MDKGAVQQVRSFNRIVAQRIGALDDRFLNRDRPIGEARLLWEIGSQGAEIRELRSRLGIDSGYFSRVLRSLEKQKLVRTRVVPEDRRLRRFFSLRPGWQNAPSLNGDPMNWPQTFWNHFQIGNAAR